MRNMLKATTLERKFPLLAVENGCIISKDADITVAFRVELPELFTVTSAEYEAIHSAWYKAIKVLPDYSIVHKQDFFIKESEFFAHIHLLLGNTIVFEYFTFFIDLSNLSSQNDERSYIPFSK